MAIQDRYQLSYRAAEAQKVMGWIKAGQSGCIVGLRGAGKSNFLRFLLRKNVKQKYLGRLWINYSFVHLDLLSLTDYSEQAVYDLILDRLMAQTKVQGLTSPEAIFPAETIGSHNRRLGRRAIEYHLQRLLRTPLRHLVLLLDEFDSMFASADPALLRSLRAFRDDYKDRLTIIVVVSDDLANLRSDLSQVEHFYRLVSRNVCGLGPYTEPDARQMIRHLLAQDNFELTSEAVQRLIELCGGHAGLLKAALSLRGNKPEGGHLEKTFPDLSKEPTIQAECGRIWNSLSGPERQALQALAGGAVSQSAAPAELKLKGLILGDPPRLIFSPLFSTFVSEQSPSSRGGLSVDRTTGKVYIEGRLVATLKGLELEELWYLFDRRGHICTKDEIMQNVYRQRYVSGTSDQMLQTLVARLRKKIEPNPERPQYILTVRGEGYRLMEFGSK